MGWVGLESTTNALKERGFTVTSNLVAFVAPLGRLGNASLTGFPCPPGSLSDSPDVGTAPRREGAKNELILAIGAKRNELAGGKLKP